MSRTTRLLLTLTALLPCALLAQEQEPAPPTQRALPQPIVTLDVVGPAALRRAFLATNVGNLLGSDDSSGVWAKIFLEFAHVWYRSEGAHKEDTFGAFRKLCAGYGGRMRLRLFVLEEYPNDVQGVLELLPDGRTDLEAVARGLRQLMANANGGKTAEKKLLGRSFRVLPGEFDHVTLPTVHRDRVVVFFSEKLGKTVGRLDAVLAQEPPRRAPKAPVSKAAGPEAPVSEVPARLHIDIAHARQVFEGFGDKLVSKDALDSWFGLKSAKGLTLRLAPHGPHVRLDCTLETGPRAGALFDVVLPIAKEPVLDSLPNARRWSKLPFSWTALWQLLLTAGTEEDFRQFLRFDLKGDLLDNLKPGLAMLGDDFSDCCFVFEVRDAAAVEKSMNKLLELGVGIADTTSESKHRGIGIRTRPARPYDHDCHAASCKGRFLLAFGDVGREHLEATIDILMDPEAKPPQRPALFRTRTARPPGHNGAGVMASRNLSKAMVPTLLDQIAWALGEALPKGLEIQKWRKQVQELGPLFKRHELGDVVWYSGRTKQHLHVRFVW